MTGLPGSITLNDHEWLHFNLYHGESKQYFYTYAYYYKKNKCFFAYNFDIT